MLSLITTSHFQSLVKDIKQYKEGYLTNYFVSPQKTESWINAGLLSYKVIGKTLFIEKQNNGFTNLYYISTKLEQLATDMEMFYSSKKNNIFIIDIIGNSSDVENVLPVFKNLEFHTYTTLSRMSRSVIEKQPQISPNNNIFKIRNAINKDLHKIEEFFNTYFDKYAEQIPTIDDLQELNKENRVIVAGENDQQIAGFLIYEMNGKTGYLRYWFVHPDFRDMKIGSLLLNNFFELCHASIRQLFWVIDSNENAIKRYEHYGFRKEDMKDCILINKKIIYEG